jgi:dUTP pyrophosphatase
MHDVKELRYATTMYWDRLERKHLSDAGVDVHANKKVIVPPFSSRIVPTGAFFDIPEGTMLLAKPKGRHDFLIGAGVIDAGYQGEILIRVVNPYPRFIVFQRGDAVAQLVLLPVLTPKLIDVPYQELYETNSSRGSTGGIWG